MPADNLVSHGQEQVNIMHKVERVQFCLMMFLAPVLSQPSLIALETVSDLITVVTVKMLLSTAKVP